MGGESNRLVQADAVAWLEADGGSYDLIFCDPPTFSNSASADDFDVQREHVRLLRAAVARLAQGGAVYFSNNFRRFRLDADAVAEFADCEDISAQTIPQDFARSEEHTSELQSLMRISYAVFCLKKKKNNNEYTHIYSTN